MSNLLLLEKPANELDISKELKEFMQQSGFANLNQMLQYCTGELLKMEGFGYRQLKEIYTFLEAHQLSSMLKE
jgi:hypothetical protein